MTGTIRASVNDILNQVGVEVGLEPVANPFSDTDKSYRQLRYLLTTAGEELSQLYEWDFLRGEMSFTTDGTNEFDLPSDFLYLLNQTGWDRTDDNPVSGPLSAQDWAYLYGRDMTSSTLYLSFRLTEDKLFIYPDTDTGSDVYFEYISRNWVDQNGTGTYTDTISTGGDVPRFNRTLIQRMLKVKFLEAKGFDTSKAQADLNQSFALLTARNKGAPILNTKGGSRQFPYLNYGSIPDTGYGS